MHDLAFIILTYVAMIILAFCVGATATELGIRWRKLRKRPSPLSDDAFWLIHEWTHRNRWYHENSVLRQFAVDEHERLTRDEPKLTLPENLEKVASAVREKYPAAFVTLH